jgi:hypothetical protein
VAKKRTKKVAARKPRKAPKPRHGFGVIKIPRGVNITWGSEWSPLNIDDYQPPIYEGDDRG